jgi:dihydropteroate synthase
MVNLPGLAGTPSAGRCLVMGVVNVTPDSFSDGGRWFGAGEAIEHGLRLMAEGADIVDVGGESTRPGAQRVSADEELRRVKPVITELVEAGVVVSVDTMRAQVAEWALEAGVSLVNDVSGGLADPYMARLVAKAGVPYVVVHWRGHSHDMYSRASYADVVREVHDELAQRVGAMIAEGVDPSMIVLDPGLGFSKNPAPFGPEAHNWQLLAGLPELASIGDRVFPVLVGASRKRYLSKLFDEAGDSASGLVPRPYTENDAATVSITALSAAAGAWCVRVHQVPANADAVRVAAAYRAARA